MTETARDKCLKTFKRILDGWEPTDEAFWHETDSWLNSRPWVFVNNESQLFDRAKLMAFLERIKSDTMDNASWDEFEQQLDNYLFTIHNPDVQRDIADDDGCSELSAARDAKPAKLPATVQAAHECLMALCHQAEYDGDHESAARLRRAAAVLVAK